MIIKQTIATATDRQIRISTHQRPDWDALGFVCVLERALFALTDARFIPAGTTDPDADFVGDTGGGAFDHHHLVGGAGQTSATKLVYEALIDEGYELAYLAPFVDMINECDLGRPNASRELGIHALLSAKKAQRAGDYELLDWARGVFRDLADGLEIKANARRDFEASLVATIESIHGRCRAAVLVPNAPRGATQAAFAAGYDIVFYENVIERDGETKYIRGAVRRNEAAATIHLGQMVTQTIRRCEEVAPAISAELAQWFQHPAGFMVGISEKADGGTEPMAVSLLEVAQQIMA